MVLDGDAIKVTYVNNTGGAYLYLRDALTLDSDLTVGQTYKMTVDAKMDGTAAQITYDRTGSGDLVNFGNLTTEWDTYELYFTAKHATNSDLRFNNLNVGEIGYVKNFSLKAIFSLIKESILASISIILVFNSSITWAVSSSLVFSLEFSLLF